MTRAVSESRGVAGAAGGPRMTPFARAAQVGTGRGGLRRGGRARAGRGSHRGARVLSPPVRRARPLAPSRPNEGSALLRFGRAIPALPCADPSEGNPRASEGSRLPNGETGLPRRGSALPRAGNALPTEGKARPCEGTARPTEGSARPGEGSARPGEGTARPSEGSARPRESNRGATFAWSLPIEGSPLPTKRIRQLAVNVPAEAASSKASRESAVGEQRQAFGFFGTASTARTPMSSDPKPRAMSASMRRAIAGRTVSSLSAANSIIRRVSLRAMVSSNVGA